MRGYAPVPADGDIPVMRASNGPKGGLLSVRSVLNAAVTATESAPKYMCREPYRRRWEKKLGLF